MRQTLYRKGYVRMSMPEHRAILHDLITDMRREGHAVTIADEVIDGKITSTSAYHYMTCTVCRRLPSARDLDIVEKEKLL